ncbi:hypothetical protein [Rufibacter immobilis]|uniref:hypothetical protein n=1 Tax=Rufibacter immobilis TaxID=1348778 RepID=UPI0035EC9A1C
MPDKINNTSNADETNRSADSENNSANTMNQGKQSSNTRQSVSDNDSYRRIMTGYDSSKQDENFMGTEKTGADNTIDERDNNDGDANQENNY